MEERNRKKKSLVRETLDVIYDEEAVMVLIQKDLQKNYPDFVFSGEIHCGMSQGEGYFEEARFVGVAEYEEVVGSTGQAHKVKR